MNYESRMLIIFGVTFFCMGLLMIFAALSGQIKPSPSIHIIELSKCCDMEVKTGMYECPKCKKKAKTYTSAVVR